MCIKIEEHMQKEGNKMKKFDYSFLDNGLLPANLINITGTVYSLKTGAKIRKDEYEKIFTELLNKGYQKINNELWIKYLKNILRNNNVNSSIDEAFNKEINNNRINL